MFTLITGYADYIFHVIFKFNIQRSKFGRTSDKSVRNSENSWTPWGSWACFFQLQGPLALAGPRALPSVKWSGGQDCRGKVKSEALLSTAKETVQIMLSEFVIQKTGCQNVDTLSFGLGRNIKR